MLALLSLILAVVGVLAACVVAGVALAAAAVVGYTLVTEGGALPGPAFRTLVAFRLRNLPHRLRGWRAELAHLTGARSMIAPGLTAVLTRADGTVIPLGVVGRRMVTDAGVAYLVNCLRNLAEPENLNFHASGTGTTAEAVGQTALVTEIGTRVSGTQSAPSANVYQTQATISYSGANAITEHGLFSASTVGTLLDRTLFAAVNVVNGDSIQFTYQFTLTSGG